MKNLKGKEMNVVKIVEYKEELESKKGESKMKNLKGKLFKGFEVYIDGYWVQLEDKETLAAGLVFGTLDALENKSAKSGIAKAGIVINALCVINGVKTVMENFDEIKNYEKED